MKAMVIGGAGFIGSYLCGALLGSGHDVVCVDDFSNGTRENVRHLMDQDGFTLYEADAAGKSALSEVFRIERPEAVYHLAANSDIQASAANPDVEYKNTYTTTFRVLSCMREYGVRKLFFASTSAVYGDKRDILLSEDTPGLSPISYYGAAKLGSEALISAFSYMGGFTSLIFRFPNVIGPGLTHGVIFDFIRKLQRDPVRLEILGDGKQTKPYLYVSDLVDAIVEFTAGSKAEEKAGVTLYNIGVESATSVTRIADIICGVMGLDGVKYEYTGGEGGWKGDVPKFSYCLDRIHAAGWSAGHTSDEAVERTVREEWKRMAGRRGQSDA